MQQTALTRRPLIDPTPERPLEFHGFRIGRDGNVYASTAPATHGRANPNYEVRIGTIKRDGLEGRGRRWVASTDGGLTFTRFRQQDAAKALYDWYQERERAHGGVR